MAPTDSPFPSAASSTTPGRGAAGATRRVALATGTGGIAALFGGLLAGCGGGASAPAAGAWDQQKTSVEFYVDLTDIQANTIDNLLLSGWRRELAAYCLSGMRPTWSPLCVRPLTVKSPTSKEYPSSSGSRPGLLLAAIFSPGSC